MKNSEISKEESGYYGYLYFPKEILPMVQTVWQRTIKRSMSYEHCDDMMIIYVREGRGTLYINEKVYPVQRGYCSYILCFDYYKLVPDESEALVVDCLRASNGASLFVWNITHQPEYQIKLQDYDYLPVNLDETSAGRFEEIFDEMYDIKKKPDPNRDALLTYLFVEISGRYHSCIEHSGMTAYRQRRLPSV